MQLLLELLRSNFKLTSEGLICNVFRRMLRISGIYILRKRYFHPQNVLNIHLIWQKKGFPLYSL